MYLNFRQSRIVQMPRIIATQTNQQQQQTQQQQTPQQMIGATLTQPVINQNNQQPPPMMSQNTQQPVQPVLGQLSLGTVELSSESRQQTEPVLLPPIKSEPSTPVTVAPVNVAPITPTSMTPILDDYQSQSTNDVSLDQLSQFLAQQPHSQNVNLSQRQFPLTDVIVKQQQQQQAIAQLLLQQQQIAEQSRMMLSEEQIARIIAQIHGYSDKLTQKKEREKVTLNDEQIARVVAMMQVNDVEVSQKASSAGKVERKEKQSANVVIEDEVENSSEDSEYNISDNLHKTRSGAKLSGKIWLGSKGDAVKAEALSISHGDPLDTPKGSGRKRGRPKKINYDEQEKQAKEIRTDFKEDVFFIYSNGDRVEITEKEHTQIMHSLQEMREKVKPQILPNIKTETPDR